MKKLNEKEDIQLYLMRIVIDCYKTSDFNHAARFFNLLNTRNIKEIIDYLALYGAMTITLKDGVYGVKKDKSQGKQDLKKIINNMRRITFFQYIIIKSNGDATYFDKALLAKLRKAYTEVQPKKVQIREEKIAERKARRESKLGNNGLGKFGVPQDKYRWGFFGNKSMEYDIWRKGG